MKIHRKCLCIITLHIKRWGGEGGGPIAHRHSHITTLCVIDPVLINPKQTPEQL